MIIETTYQSAYYTVTMRISIWMFSLNYFTFLPKLTLFINSSKTLIHVNNILVRVPQTIFKAIVFQLMFPFNRYLHFPDFLPHSPGSFLCSWYRNFNDDNLTVLLDKLYKGRDYTGTAHT